jgi:hypothetical protein
MTVGPSRESYTLESWAKLRADYASFTFTKPLIFMYKNLQGADGGWCVSKTKVRSQIEVAAYREGDPLATMV